MITKKHKQGGPELYLQLGNVQKISAMVDELIGMFVKVQQMLVGSRQIADRAKLEPVRLPLATYHVSLFVCMLAGGPERFVGPKLSSAASGLRVTPEAWKQLEAAVKVVMNKYAVSPTTQAEVMKRLSAQQKEIIASSNRDLGPPLPINGSGVYQQIGGDGRIALLVDRYFQLLATDRVGFGAVKLTGLVQRAGLTVPGLKVTMIDALCATLGGPQQPVTRTPLSLFRLDANDQKLADALWMKAMDEIKINKNDQKTVETAFRRLR